MKKCEIQRYSTFFWPETSPPANAFHCYDKSAWWIMMWLYDIKKNLYKPRITHTWIRLCHCLYFICVRVYYFFYCYFCALSDKDPFYRIEMNPFSAGILSGIQIVIGGSIVHIQLNFDMDHSLLSFCFLSHMLTCRTFCCSYGPVSVRLYFFAYPYLKKRNRILIIIRILGLECGY